MYTIYADDICIYNDQLPSDTMRVLSPKLVLEDSAAGSLTMTLPPSNVGYSTITRMVTDISVRKDGDEIWAGRVLSEDTDFWNNRVLFCEGELAFLNDTTQPQAKYQDVTVRGFLETLVAIHNVKVAENRQFTVGVVTVTDPNDSLYRYTNYEKTIECINDKMIDRLGGHIRIRKVNGTRYLDYLADYPNTNSQTIEFGKNLLDFTRSWDSTEFATVILPLGARLDESPIEALDAYLTVESVNNGSKYVQSADAVSTYGWIEKVVNWDDVTVASNLLKKANAYLSDIQFDDMEIELKALDFHYLNADYEAVKLLDQIRVISKPHGMDRLFPVSKLEIPLDEPENTVFTLGDTVKASFTNANNKTNSEILKTIDSLPKSSTILEEARTNASALIKMATNGYITITEGDNGTNELIISNELDYTKADKIWRWNINGLGYSDDGYNGTYDTAITMDGTIVGERIATGSITADQLSITYKNQVSTEISDAEDNANGYTDEKLKGYYTSVEIETKITNNNNSILLSAKQTAMDYTDTALQNYYTISQIDVKVNSITSSVTEAYELGLYNYILNGNFADGLSNWTKTTSPYLTTYGSVTCVHLACTDSYGYISQTVTVYETSTFKIRFNAARPSSSSESSCIKVSFNDVEQVLNSGDVTTSWKTFEFTFSNVSAGSIEVYFFCPYTNTEAYITDIEVLGPYTYYSQSQIKQTADSITSEVTTINNTRSYYGTCSTAGDTATKEVSCSSFPSALVKGVAITVYFTHANTVSSPSLKINNTTKTIYLDGSSLTSSDYYWGDNSTVNFVYNGTYWVISDSGAMSKIKQTADSITSEVTTINNTRSYYGTCSTAGDTRVKEVTCSSFPSTLKTGVYISVYFEYANTVSSPSLKIINSDGDTIVTAKTIHLYGSSLTSSYYYWGNGSTVNFVYNGTYWDISDSGSMSKIKQTAEQVSVVVTDGYISSTLSAESGTITIGTGRLIINANNFKLTKDGTLTATNATLNSATLTSSNDTCSVKINGGYYYGYHGEDLAGYISTYALVDDDKSMNIVAKEAMVIRTPALYVKDSYSEPGSSGSTVYKTFTGSKRVRVYFGDDDSYGYQNQVFYFVNGLLRDSWS